MKALLLTAHGDASVLACGELPTPTPGPGEALVRLQASGVNHMDLLIRNGYPGIAVQLPHVLGGDVVGLVAAVGRGVTTVREGDRVIAAPVSGCGHCERCVEGQEFLCDAWQYLGFHRPGGYAQFCCVPARSLLALPESIDAGIAAALPVAGLTAFHAMTSVAQLRAGQTIFIWGGAGALGTMSIQIARALGLRPLIAASSEEKRALGLRLGAELALDPNDADFADRLRAVAPAGVDAVLDSVGAQTFPRSFSMVRKGGQLLLCGMIGGREAPLSIHQTYLRHLSVRGLYLGSRAELATLVRLVADRTVNPHIGTRIPFEQAAAGQQLLESRRNQGKIALLFS